MKTKLKTQPELWANILFHFPPGIDLDFAAELVDAALRAAELEYVAVYLPADVRGEDGPDG